ncbi:hypothetical protein GDO86_010544 [Hymenochirus boettgeri]|uniref:Uncharacterized protein n=1 Tax=Hymenochirus boettgeri TaxID=247094 RepID=A0A8T2JKM1_9PIPI|nr:hypothetical protein GDO86_010544 [Hymenochirus boettgeri]
MFISDLLTILLTALLCLIMVRNVFNQKRSILYNYPPGPKPLPIIGNLHILSGETLQTYFRGELSKKYGSIFTVHVGGEKTVVLCDYETVKEALHAEDILDRPFVSSFDDFLHGYENWKIMRRFALSTLRDYGMGRKLIEDKIKEESDYLVETFKSYKGKAFLNTIVISAAVANIIVSILIGHRFDNRNPKFLRLVELIKDILRLLGSPSVLEKNNNELYFHHNNFTSLITNLFIAGTETTSTTIQWALFFMMKHPEIQTNVQKEIEKVIGSSRPQSEHRKLMPYTNAVIHETQRFANIFPLNVPHSTTRDVKFKGYVLPKVRNSSDPMLSPILNDKDRFQRPDEFYPQHFLDSEGNFIRNENFLPFSTGRRSCVGENLAKMEIFLFFTRLLQNFTLRAPPGTNFDLPSGIGFTSIPPYHKMCAMPRTQI